VRCPLIEANGARPPPFPRLRRPRPAFYLCIIVHDVPLSATHRDGTTQGILPHRKHLSPDLTITYPITLSPYKVWVQPRSSAVNTTLPTFAADAPLLQDAAAVDRYRLLARCSAANPPLLLSIDGIDGQTLDCFIDRLAYNAGTANDLTLTTNP